MTMKRLILFICTVFMALGAGAQNYTELFASEEALNFRATADSLASLGG